MKARIQVDKKVMNRVESTETRPKESYDKQELSERTVRNIEEALKDIKHRRLYTTKQVKKKLGK